MKIKTIAPFSSVLSVLLAGSVIAAEPVAKWNTSVSGKVPLLEKSSQIDAPLVNTRREPVSFSYAISADEPLEFSPPVFVEKSRQYWLDTTGGKLATGLALPVTGGQTVIRISPMDNKSVTLDASHIQLQAAGKVMPLDVFADARSLQKTGVPFPENTVAFKAHLPAGAAMLKVSGLADSVPVVVHVFEPESDQVLALSTTKATFNAGESVQVTATVLDDNLPQAADLQGYVSLPDGRLAGELRFVQEKNGDYRASLPLGALTGLANGLWEVHVFARNDKLMRDAQTAFAVSLPVAAFDGRLQLGHDKAGTPGVNVGIDVATEGRYEVRGVLFGRDASGKAVPFAVTMSAAWLPAGNQSVTLPIDTGLIAQSGLSAPFEIRQVQLMDQSRLAPVQTVTEGITIMDMPRIIDGLDSR